MLLTIGVVCGGKALVFAGRRARLRVPQRDPARQRARPVPGRRVLVRARTRRAGQQRDPGDLYALVLNTALVSMALTPIVAGLTTPVYGWISTPARRASRCRRSTSRTGLATTSSSSGRAAWARTGRGAATPAAPLRRWWNSTTGGSITHARRATPIVYGDAPQPTVLEAAASGSPPRARDHAGLRVHAASSSTRAGSTRAPTSWCAPRTSTRCGRCTNCSVDASRAAGVRGQPGDDQAGPAAPRRAPRRSCSHRPAARRTLRTPVRLRAAGRPQGEPSRWCDQVARDQVDRSAAGQRPRRRVDWRGRSPETNGGVDRRRCRTTTTSSRKSRAGTAPARRHPAGRRRITRPDRGSGCAGDVAWRHARACLTSEQQSTGPRRATTAAPLSLFGHKRVSWAGRRWNEARRPPACCPGSATSPRLPRDAPGLQVLATCRSFGSMAISSGWASTCAWTMPRPSPWPRRRRAGRCRWRG